MWKDRNSLDVVFQVTKLELPELLPEAAHQLVAGDLDQLLGATDALPPLVE